MVESEMYKGRHDYYVKCSTHFFEIQNQNTPEHSFLDWTVDTSDKMNFRLDIKQNFCLEPLDLDKDIT